MTHICPIPDCNRSTPTRQGWNGHVAAPQNHPHWRPEVTDYQERKQLFRQTFPQWFDDRARERARVR